MKPVKKMHILGTGTATVARYVNTACAFDDGESLFLVDGTGGADILRSFDVMGLDWARLHHAFLSHEHTDHFLGMIWVLRNIGELMILNQYEGDFTLYGHREVLDKIRAVCSMILKPQNMEYFDQRIFLIPVEDGQTETLWKASFTFFDILSTKAKQFGFLMVWPDSEGEGETRILFPGDEPLTESGEAYCRDIDWLLSEAFCLYRDREIFNPYQYHHKTVKESALMAEKHHVKNLLLWHTEDRTFGSRKASYTEEASRYYSGKIWVPDDFETIVL